MAMTEKILGIHFPLQPEHVVYVFKDRMTRDYSGGYREFYALSNGYIRSIHVIHQASTNGREILQIVRQLAGIDPLTVTAQQINLQLDRFQ